MSACKGFERGAAVKYLNDLKQGRIYGGHEDKQTYFKRIGMNADEVIPLKTVESEYIDHLKKQVHYLEVEASYLRNMRKRYNAMRRRARCEKLGLDPNDPENGGGDGYDGNDAEQDVAVERMKQYRQVIAENKQKLVDKDKALSLINQHRQELLNKIEKSKMQHRKDVDALTLGMTERMKRNDALRGDIARRDRECQASRFEVQRLMGETVFVDERLAEAKYRLEKAQRDRDRLQVQLAEKERLAAESAQRKQQLQTELAEDRIGVSQVEQELHESKVCKKFISHSKCIAKCLRISAITGRSCSTSIPHTRTRASRISRAQTTPASVVGKHEHDARKRNATSRSNERGKQLTTPRTHTRCGRH